MADLSELSSAFPHLLSSEFKFTSEPAPVPNCIGWALYDMRQFWQPGSAGVHGYYWPPGVSTEENLESWAQVFRLHGYQECDGPELEPATEKVAIYADASGMPQHVARQLATDAWTSKLGKDHDIEHATLDALAGGDYGAVALIMKRPRKA